MSKSSEELQGEISILYNQETAKRAVLKDLDSQYRELTRAMRSLRSEITVLEQQRLKLETQLKGVRKVPTHKRGGGPKPAQPSLTDMIASMSVEQREALALLLKAQN